MLNYRRGKRKVIADYKTDDIYKFYKQKYGDEALSRKAFMKILKETLPELVKLMIFENFEFSMPARLGTMRIKKKLVEPKLDENGDLDVRSLSVNYKKTKELWEELYPDKTPEEIKEIKDKPLVRELNEHTDGYRFIWYWDRLTCNIPNQSAYSIDMTRTYDRQLSNAAKTIKNLDYYE
jgi:hypothetical protein